MIRQLPATIVFVVLFVLNSQLQAQPAAEDRSLKQAVGERFKIGVGVGAAVLTDVASVDLITEHFQILTPENCMKPQSIHPDRDRWSFETADRFVRFATDHQMEVVGHCLVWAKDDRTDDWMKVQEDGQPISRQQLLSQIEEHIETVVTRYRDNATMWDVVNEALADGEDGYLRDSVYSQTTGIDFIETAFRTARRHDPDALLIYNDYNCHFPAKRKKLIRLLTELKQRGVPIDAYGMQGHFELGDQSLTQLRETFDQLRQLQIQVVVSELDIDVVTRGRWWADDGKHREVLKQHDPYREGLPDREAQQQAEQYVALFRLFDEYQDVIARVSFWNLHDGQSWLNDFPWKRTNHPLLFDRELRAKSAFDAVYDFLEGGKIPHEAVQRTDELSIAAHQQLIQKARTGTIDVYFQGDSITRRWGATDYPHLLKHWNARFKGWNVANFAWGGDNTHNMLWRMQNGELTGVNPKVVVIQAGANNLPWTGPASPGIIEETVEGIQAIVQEFRQSCPEATIVVTGLFPRDQNPDLRPAIAQINQRLRSIAERDGIRFIDIYSKLLDSQGRFRAGYSVDGLHLEEPAYEVWAKALRPIFEETLGPPAATDHAPPPTGIPARPNR